MIPNNKKKNNNNNQGVFLELLVAAKKPYPNQAFAHESSKVGRRGKRDRKDRGQEADGKKGSPTKQKHI